LRRRAATHLLGACQHPHRHDSSIVRDRPHAQGAPRAVMRPRFATDAPLAVAASQRSSRSHSIGCESVVGWSRTGPRNVEGPPGIPGRPFSADDALHHLPGEPPRESASPPGPGKNPVPTSPVPRRARVRPLGKRHGHAMALARLAAAGSWLCPCRRSDTGFLGRGFVAQLANSDANRTMMRRIAVSNRSVKRFFAEIHKDAWRLAFRRSGGLSCRSSPVAGRIRADRSVGIATAPKAHVSCRAQSRATDRPACAP
jgi:hypothetical protein